MQQLEGLGCECVVATVIPSDGGTYITGTPVAVQYFSEIQKIQAMADYVNPLDPSSENSDEIPNDAMEDSNSTGRQRSQLGTGTKDDSNEPNKPDDPSEAGGDKEMNEGEEDKTDLDRKDEEVVRAGKCSRESADIGRVGEGRFGDKSPPSARNIFWYP